MNADQTAFLSDGDQPTRKDVSLCESVVNVVGFQCACSLLSYC